VPEPTTEPSQYPPGPLLEATGLTKDYPGLRALDGVDFTLRAGEIHALMGENGAGKSTLIKVLTGATPSDGGRVRLAGESIQPHSPMHAQQLGISTVYQEVNLIPDLSVAENLYLGREPVRLGRIDWRQVRRGARSALERMHLSVDVSRPLRSCSIAMQQMIAIARALDLSARVLILDEPTSSLDRKEVEQLFSVLRRLRDEGLAILFVTHFLDQVYAVSDRITVLRNGRLVGAFVTKDLPRVQLVNKMIGREVATGESRGASVGADEPSGEPVLSARALGRRNAIEPFDLDIHPGEVVGLAGLLGSGRTEAARLLFGLDRPTSGRVAVRGRPLRLRSPRRAMAAGLGLLPEDRKSQGIIAELSVRENIVLAMQAGRGWLRAIPLAAQRRLAEKYIKALHIATTDADKPVRELSGGNQQKVVLARWLATEPVVLILDEPTRGVDVGAKEEIERLIGTLRDDGLAILFISSELEEVVRDSQRVIVLRDRRTVGELRGDKITEPKVMEMIAGGAS